MTDLNADERAELEALRARLATLEAERQEEASRTALAIARASDRLYWLDRWHLDLNGLMAKPGAAQARAVVRIFRRPVRWLRRLRYHFSK
jgi:hypothetical protein